MGERVGPLLGADRPIFIYGGSYVRGMAGRVRHRSEGEPTMSKTLDDDTPRPVREFEIIDSDRMDLVAEAVYFCRVIADRQGAFKEDWSQTGELNDDEKAAYSAALRYLAQEFGRGASKVRRVLKRE